MTIADGAHVAGTPAGTYDNVAYTPADLAYRHGKSIIAGFLDGHVVASTGLLYGVANLGELTSTVDQNLSFTIDATAPADGIAGRAALTVSGITTGKLTTTGIGSHGYALFDWQAGGDSTLNIKAPFTAVTKGGTWASDQYCKYTYTIGATTAGGKALYASKVGTVAVKVSDFEAHTLTIFSPARFADVRRFSLAVSTDSGAGKESTILYDYTTKTHQCSKVMQVSVRGNAKITVTTPSGGATDSGTFSMVFLD